MMIVQQRSYFLPVLGFVEYQRAFMIADAA